MSATDATLSATAQITVINHVLVSVLPARVTLAPLAVQPFSAAVLGASNQSVTWEISGAGCSAGEECAGRSMAAATTRRREPRRRRMRCKWWP